MLTEHWMKSSRSEDSAACIEVRLTDEWTKSSRSGTYSNCVEVRLTDTWRKSSRSSFGGECVEVRYDGPVVEVRDTKDQSGPTLRFTAHAWTAFLDQLNSEKY